ncbi:hypothetical protein NRI_0116 [Neorickettsia risticii str. Illinois]|uniref:Uncharacterized protein n=1 Tax=Neorickettsia risticii (strain Illinois) TaxID=434131 RepID=C6V3Z7_NEORI|nr:hypothetical protein NRI_0116 [Neorickettsia risticii str. Illinois]
MWSIFREKVFQHRMMKLLRSLLCQIMGYFSVTCIEKIHPIVSYTNL